jgi:hypothetical protein
MFLVFLYVLHVSQDPILLISYQPVLYSAHFFRSLHGVNTQTVTFWLMPSVLRYKGTNVSE